MYGNANMIINEDREKADIIMDIVREYYHLTSEQLRSKSRKREYVTARFICFHFMKKYTRMSLASIGLPLGKDHADVLHGIRVVNDLVEFNGMGEEIRVLEQRIEARINPYSVQFERWIKSMGSY